VADLVACGALLVDQCASGLVDAGRVSSCKLEPTFSAAEGALDQRSRLRVLVERTPHQRTGRVRAFCGDEADGR
jgi:hypothetical protein